MRRCRFTFFRSRPIRKNALLRQIAIAVGAAATIVVTAAHVRPVFLGKNPIAAPVLAAANPNDVGDSLSVLEPWLYTPFEMAKKSERFIRDREAFALDLIRTGRVAPVRARKLAEVAVTEAYRQRVPPALILGVMITENDEFKSTARSKVGALGLMQVYGKHWRELGRRYGTNLRDDSVNLRTGIHILRYMTGVVPDTMEQGSAWRKALLSYNGCVKGTNTPNCRRYPDVVRRNVERTARATCAGRDFEQCVVQPLYVAMQSQD